MPSCIHRCGEWKRAATCAGISSSCSVSVGHERSGVKTIDPFCYGVGFGSVSSITRAG